MKWLILAVFIIEVVIAIFLITMAKEMRQTRIYLTAEYADRVHNYDLMRGKFDQLSWTLGAVAAKVGVALVTEGPGGSVPAQPQPPFPPP